MMAYEELYKKIRTELENLKKGQCHRPDLFEILRSRGFTISERARNIKQIAERNGYMIYDGFPDQFKEYDPKIVFVTDQHGHFDDKIASMFEQFVGANAMRLDHVLTMEGESGELVFEKSEIQKDGSLVYTLKDAVRERKFIDKGYLAKIFPMLKQKKIFCVEFCDDIKLGEEFVEKYLEFNEARANLEKLTPETMAELNQKVDAYFAPLVKRSERFLNNLIYYGSYSACRWKTFQVYGIVDHLLGTVQNGLQKKGISFMSLVPKQISSDTGFEHVRKTIVELSRR